MIPAAAVAASSSRRVGDSETAAMTPSSIYPVRSDATDRLGAEANPLHDGIGDTFVWVELCRTNPATAIKPIPRHNGRFLRPGAGLRHERMAMEIDLGRILDALPAMVWTALPDGRIDFVNRRWSEYTGFSLGEAHGWEWQAAINPDDLPKLLERWRSILASGEPGEMEARVRRLDGQYRCFLVQCSPICDDAGRIVKWCGVATDVEDFRRAEEAMRRRELDFQLIVDSIPVPVAVTTPSGEVEGLNQPTLDYFGKTFEELKGWKASDVVHPDDLSRRPPHSWRRTRKALRTTLRAATVALTASTAGTMSAASRCGIRREHPPLVPPADRHRRPEARGRGAPCERAQSWPHHQHDSRAGMVDSRGRLSRLLQPALS